MALMAHQPVTFLSPSQAKMLIQCQAKWYFKYLMKLPESTDGGLALGRAVHAAVEKDLKWKLLAKRDLPEAQVVRSFVEAFAGELKQAELREDESAAALEALGESLVKLWMREAAPRIRPALVERDVAGAIGGVRVVGRVDLVDEDGTIVDLKTTGRTPSEVEPDHLFQVATYRRLLPQASGHARVDHLVKLKTPKLVTVEADVKAEDVRFVDAMYPLAAEVIRTGLYMPNRSCRLCSRKYCSFWRACEQEFGGRVKE